MVTMSRGIHAELSSEASGQSRRLVAVSKGICRGDLSQGKSALYRRFIVSQGQWKIVACAASLIARSITPGDVLHEAAVENILVSSSRAQAKIVLEFARESLGDTPGYRWSDTGVIHKASRARVRIISSDSTTGTRAWCTRPIDNL